MDMTRRLLCFALLTFAILCGQSALAAGPSDKTTDLDEIQLITRTEAPLKALLRGEYGAFRENFEVAANPVRLKDGGLFVDGWRDGRPTTDAAAVISYPDGRLYAAYFNAKVGKIRYFGGKSERIHPAIQLWAKRFGPQFEISHDRNATGMSPSNGEVTPASTSTPNAAEQEELRKVAASIWNQSLANGWDMNADVGNILSTVTKEIMDCSAAFSLVPRPVGFVPGWLYVASTSFQIVAYITGVSDSQVYRTCVVSASLTWRSQIEFASAGI